MTYTAYWYRLPHGKETDPMQAQWKDFDDLEKAIQFIRRKEEIIRGIYWAGAHVEDELGNYIFEITSDGSEYMSNNDHVDDNKENISNNDVSENEEKTDKKPTTFNEATKMYVDYFGVRPMLDDIASVYDTYMQRWREFDSFKKFLVYTIEGEKPISSEPTTFKEAYKMYIDYFGKFPRNSEIKKLYKTYQKCWRVFGSFKKYLTYAINTERTENHDTIR